MSLTPGFIVAHSHRLEDLTEVAVTFTRRFPLQPLQQETVLVQSNGIAQWLKVNLAQANGIAAMLDITLPARFQWQAYRAVLGDDIPKISPFDKDRLTWRLLRIVPELVATDDRFTPLQHYLATDNDGRKAHQLAAKLADLFDQYAVYRADWLAQWLNNNDTLNNGQAIDSEQLWQPALWRAVSADVGLDQYWNNRAALHQAFLEKARGLSAAPAGIPPRIIVFGISSLPQQVLEVLDALKGCTQILLCVHNPSQYHWADIVDGKEALKKQVKAEARRPRKQDYPEQIAEQDLHQFAQPLLASWGKQGRDYIRLLDNYDETVTKQEALNQLRLDIFDPHPTEHLLGQLQDDILQLRSLAETQAQWPAPTSADSSIQFHRCHSPLRELEVLHDHLLDAFAEDPTLAPRDIMVMLPDVNTYAPYIDAVFGKYHTGNDPRAIPYTIADQGQRHQQPLMIGLELLLQAEQIRFNQSELLTLLNVPAIQQRFDIRADQIPTLARWIEGAGARWGLSAKQRQSFFMPVTDETNSWWFALKRMLSGYAIGESENAEGCWQDIAPFTDISGLEAAMVGQLAELISALEAWWQQVQTPCSMQQWRQRSEWLLDTFFSAADEQDTLLLNRLLDESIALDNIATEAGHSQTIALAVFRDAWLERIDQASLQQRFLAGRVNFATLMPMRAIPFRHVCVLGMNESEYPRDTQRVDFDLMQDDYRPGDRSRRDDDRYLFLEALLSARDVFYLSWVGFSSKDNSERTASVLVSQLLDHLQQGWQLPQQALITDHKLQAYDAVYFTDSDARYFSYAEEWAKAYDVKQHAEPNDLETEQTTEPRNVRLSDIKRFIREPSQLFFQWQLETYFQYQSQDIQDAETFTLSSLNQWQLTSELVSSGRQAIAQGSADVEQQLNQQVLSMKRRGLLGVGVIAEHSAQQLSQQAADIITTYQHWLAGGAQVIDAAHELHFRYQQRSQQWQISDAIRGLHQQPGGPRIWVATSVSNIAAKNGKGVNSGGWKHLGDYYLGYLLLNREQATEFLLISKGGCQIHLPSLDSTRAEQLLTALMDALLTTLMHAVPMHVELAMVWLDAFEKAEQRNQDNPQQVADQHAQHCYEIAHDAQKPALLETSDYCGRLAKDYSQLREHPHFMTLINNVYRPMRDVFAQATRDQQ
ncbi:exodeoxyribonuclease V subunit gamma [Idiomarina tyrosinivorans]|uniref:RecBCD enzyme subunit RecC n=1 Tax=Idiomarina tyrosinivorans TaxID=1445662 RepID=A0A432ZT32_9GAMM|nr:exodeoxyribonuclease V subunit gamma [Idiomarina tyrosinivorans]RUO81095.1 exodeoxyribonuclease V subunit gamma [Idiomarina tyrosinivorans]